ncbi:MAG: DUF2911 domain-containing protein [Rhodothermales bacterium]
MKTTTPTFPSAGITRSGGAVALLAVLFLLAGCAEQPWSPSQDEARTWVSTLGADTVAVEQFTVEGQTLTGTQIERAPSTSRIDYTVMLDDAGHVASLESTNFNVIIQDSVAILNGADTVRVPTGVIPTLGRMPHSLYVVNQVLAQKRAGQDSIHLLFPNGSVNERMVTWQSPDQFALDFFGSPITGVFDESGQLIGTSGVETTVKRDVHRVEPFDLDASEARWMAMDAAGEGLGVPSPPAVASADVDGASIDIQYAQPAVRGRTIWGGIVPFNDVWRTGANAATHLTTDRALVLGGQTVPAGTYTLWSIFESADAGQLIVNAQTNQWGTSYDAAQDVLRVDMTAVTTAEPAERFTIHIRDTDAGGELVLAWDTTEWTVPFEVE